METTEANDDLDALEKVLQAADREYSALSHELQMSRATISRLEATIRSQDEAWKTLNATDFKAIKTMHESMKDMLDQQRVSTERHGEGPHFACKL